MQKADAVDDYWNACIEQEVCFCEMLMRTFQYVFYRNIPTVYLENYLNFQVHFSIKDLITKQLTLLDCSDKK